MHFILFLKIISWGALVISLIGVASSIMGYRYYNSPMGQVELALKGQRIASYHFTRRVIYLLLSVALLVSLYF